MTKFTDFYREKIDGPFLSASTAIGDAAWRNLKLPPENLQLLTLLTATTFSVIGVLILNVIAILKWSEGLQWAWGALLVFAFVLWSRVFNLVYFSKWTWNARKYMHASAQAMTSRDFHANERMYLTGLVVFLLLLSVLPFASTYMHAAFFCAFSSNACFWLLVHLRASEPPRPDDGDRVQSRSWTTANHAAA
jgi:hypothetical protein